MLGFSEEAQGWLPCKITTVMDEKLWHENVITVRTRTGYKGSVTHRTNGKRQSGGVNEKMRIARSARRKEDPSMRDHFPKEERK